MSAQPVLIVGQARTAVAPVGGAFRALQVHDLAAPVVRALLHRANVSVDHVDALIMGNALAAGGNPARLVALAAGLPERCPAWSLDTQCCAGLDAVAMGAALISSGQAQVVIAGGAEAWSRAPVRHHRPLHAGESATPYERPAFSPDPARDPDLIEAAAQFALQHGYSRAQQNAYAQRSHLQALQHQAQTAQHMISVAGLMHDAYPRAVDSARLHRIPLATRIAGLGTRHAGSEATVEQGSHIDCGVSQLAVSAKADGAAFALLMSNDAAQRLGCSTTTHIVAHTSVGHAPDMPLLAAQAATQDVMQRTGLQTHDFAAVELHDAFAVQGLHFAQQLPWAPTQLNTHGGGLARGHPIGASGAVALVQLLTRIALAAPADRPALGLVTIAAAGGMGSAMVVKKT